jgi:hypothetical protein
MKKEGTDIRPVLSSRLQTVAGTTATFLVGGIVNQAPSRMKASKHQRFSPENSRLKNLLPWCTAVTFHGT